MTSPRPLLFLLLLAFAMPASLDAHGVLRGFVDERVVGGFNLPVTFVRLPDGRLLVAEKAGVVRVEKNGVVLPDAFLDIRGRVNDYWDRGLLGLAADPDFATNGFVYLFYVHEDDPLAYTGPKTSRVIRVTASGDTADLATELVLLRDLPADSPSHDGGAMRFGPDGMLWITTGDAASFNAVDPLALRTQQLDSFAGKLLRVDRLGRGLADNPFWSGDADAVRSKVWAYGFRNPFRLTFQPGSGRPFIADVGANDWEEVNAVGRGGNHGWPCVEGPGPQAGYQALAECQALYVTGAAGLVMPIAAYPHVTGTASVTGGAFYTGTAFPPRYRGSYFFGDFSRGTLHALAVDATGTTAGPITGFGTGIDGVVDVQADGDVLLYVSVTAGEIRRIRYVPDTGPREMRYLSDALEMVTFAANGAGPIELDRSHGALGAGDGGVLAIAGETFAKGFGVHAPADIRFALYGACSTFSTSVGVDDATGGNGSVTFEIWLDGTRVVASGVVRGGQARLSGTLDVSGRRELRLVVTDGGDGNGADFADWADARVDCARPGGDTEPPVVVTTSPEAGAIDVATTAAVTATMSEDLDPASVGTSSIVVVVDATSALVPGSVSYDVAGRRVVFTPSAPFAPGVVHRAAMAAGAVADPAGRVLAAPVIWTFTTASPVTNQAPIPVIASPLDGTRFGVGETIAFAGSATDPEDGAVPPASLHWAVTVRHCPGGVCHTHPLTSATGAGGSVVAPEHGADSFLVVTLTATDSGGRTASVSREVRPRVVRVTLRSDPPGLPVIFGESRRLSPATFEAVVGSHVNVATLTPQHSLSFVGWSSGQPAQYVLAVGANDLEDMATFRPAAGVHYLSDLQWASAVNGAGPVERDRSHGGPDAGDGGQLTLRGATYAKGLGVLPLSDVRVALGGACSAFAAVVGVDDDVQGGGTAFAGVFADGRLAWVSPLLTGVSPPVPVTVNVTGAAELRLVVVDAGDGPVNDEVDWADARMTCAGPGSAPPAAPTAMSALANGLTAGLWWPAVPGATAYRLEAGSAPGAADVVVFDLAANQLSPPVPPGVFWVRVRAMNAWGISAPSPEARLVVDGTTGVPEAPGPLTATVSGQTVRLQWSPPASGPSPSEYAVELATGPDAFVEVARTSAPSSFAAGVPPGAYVVRVRGVAASGAGIPGPTVTVVVE